MRFIGSGFRLELRGMLLDCQRQPWNWLRVLQMAHVGFRGSYTPYKGLKPLI